MDKWGNFVFNEPYIGNEIKQINNVVLPKQYLEFMKKHNGGQGDICLLYTSERMGLCPCFLFYLECIVNGNFSITVERFQCNTSLHRGGLCSGPYEQFPPSFLAVILKVSSVMVIINIIKTARYTGSILKLIKLPRSPNSGGIKVEPT